MTFSLTILSLHETLFEGEVEYLTVPTSLGEQTILRDHEPYVVPTSVGNARISVAGEERSIPLSSEGILHVEHTKTSIIL